MSIFVGIPPFFRIMCCHERYTLLQVMTRKIKNKQEFMLMKHYAPNRCEPSIEGIVKMGVRPGERGLVSSKVGGRGVVG